jgi:asparagine synthetase B (glutamine-hydrolysing)
MGLSSGYDSGAIACALNNAGAEYSAYTIRAREDMGIVEARSQLVKNHEIMRFTQADFNRHKQYLASNCDKTVISYQPMNDKASYGLSHICEAAAAKDERVYLSGQGADEIISDYGHAGRKIFQASQFGGRFPEDILSIFPYNNFYGGSQEGYILKEEIVAGSHGIETRYPFLDRALVLEFLNLKASLKNKYYKSPIHYYLDAMGFPFKVGDKRGFSANQGLDT